jgi:hypothetical protein
MSDIARIRELQGRINAIEGMAMATLGILLANAPDDQDGSRAIGLLQLIRQTVIERIGETDSADCETETRAAVDDLLSRVAENLNLLRPR